MAAISRFVMTLAICLSMGLQWAALQSVAWTSMLVENAQSASLTEALTRTFDGQHPCSLCRVAQKGQGQEKQSQRQIGSPKVQLICAARPPSWTPPFRRLSYLIVNVDVFARAETPPVPPPRISLG